mmetsp:Transcript_29553/g.76298  ORF Transcript_29553/g.76298 Transcript_29553/m.76298 type:complete len:820 (-) Transcript_29553:1606-4065(-)
MARDWSELLQKALAGDIKEVPDDYNFDIADDVLVPYLRFKHDKAKESEEVVKKWKAYVSKHGTEQGSLERTEELRKLIRKGIPHELRPDLWLLFSGAKEKLSSNNGIYQRLLVTLQTNPPEAAREISYDLDRTFPSHPYFREDAWLEKLRRVLCAFAVRNTSIGYCQGMNFLAGFLLLAMPEEHAFWTLVRVVEDFLPDYFGTNMLGWQVDHLVLSELVSKLNKKLGDHLASLEVHMPLLCSQWFLCVFVNSFPAETVARVWDLFFYEGPDVVFRVSLALLALKSETLLQAHDVGEVINTMKVEEQHLVDPSALIQVATSSKIEEPLLSLMHLRRHYRGALTANPANRFGEKKKGKAKKEKSGPIASISNRFRKSSSAAESSGGPAIARRASAPSVQMGSEEEQPHSQSSLYHSDEKWARSRVDEILASQNNKVKTRIPEVALMKHLTSWVAVYAIHVTVSVWQHERGWESGEPPEDVMSWTVLQRYSTFKVLRKRLKQRAGSENDKSAIPSLPPTKWGGRSVKPAYVEWKRTKLEEFLDGVLQMDLARTDADVRTKVAKFLCTDYQESFVDVRPMREVVDGDLFVSDEDEDDEKEKASPSPQPQQVSAAEAVRLKQEGEKERREVKRLGEPAAEEEEGEGMFGDVPRITLDTFLDDHSKASVKPSEKDEKEQVQKEGKTEDEQGRESEAGEGMLVEARRSSTVFRDPNLPAIKREKAREGQRHAQREKSDEEEDALQRARVAEDVKVHLAALMEETEAENIRLRQSTQEMEASLREKEKEIKRLRVFLRRIPMRLADYTEHAVDSVVADIEELLRDRV